MALYEWAVAHESELASSKREPDEVRDGSRLAHLTLARAR
jgi:hypothetical protein